MRLKFQIEKDLIKATSDLVEVRLKSDWGNAQVNYLLGLAVGLTMVLKPKMSRGDAERVIVERIDRSVENIKSRPDYHRLEGENKRLEVEVDAYDKYIRGYLTLGQLEEALKEAVNPSPASHSQTSGGEE